MAKMMSAAVMAGDLRSHLGGLHVDRVAVVPVERDPAEYLDAGHRGPQQIGDVVGDEIMALVHDPAIAVLLALPGQRQLVDAAGPDIGIGMYVHFDHAVEILVDGRRRGSGFAFQQAARHGKGAGKGRGLHELPARTGHRMLLLLRVMEHPATTARLASLFI